MLAYKRYNRKQGVADDNERKAEMVGFVALAGNAITYRIGPGTPAAASPLFFWAISSVGLEH